MTVSAKRIIPVILCGGSGTRLWPFSRGSYPKQFLPLWEGESLFQRTLRRIAENEIYYDPVVITNNDHRFQVADQAMKISVTLDAILLEPSARNTAPAIGAAAVYALTKDKDALVHVLPSDHLVEDDKTYREAISLAHATAEAGHLVTFGIEPTSPATGYGYIKRGVELETGAFDIATFVEKPPLEEAEVMLASGDYSWNSGMFMFRADQFMDQLNTFEPQIAVAVDSAVGNAHSDLDFIRLDEKNFSEIPSISVDYAVFERTQKAAVVPTAINWSDVGSWESFWQSQKADDQGNVVKAPATLLASRNNMIVSDRQHVALNGVSNLTIVATDDAVLVSATDRSEQIKDVVALLKQSEDTRLLPEEHKTIYRPWGGYTSILNGDRFQVKRLFVSPGKKLSLQKHHHRSEHWVVVSGTAEVTVDDQITTLSENESVYIPLGTVHRLANPGKIDLEVIEVQSGSYLGEDDIIRIEDDFGRGRTY